MASLFKNQPAAQTAKITVDAEHYCTSVTQMAMAQMYPDLIALSVTMPPTPSGLLELGCRYAQGFFYGRPEPAENFLKPL